MNSSSTRPAALPILFDTDIGSDIDDAVALAYLLRQPQCDLLGISTVSGQPEQRAMLADAICRAGGREDIPIHVGLESPLLVDPLQPEAPQAEALPRYPHRKFENTPTAVDFLRETIRARPGEITLLATGPLTNLAVLFALDPELPSLLHRLVLMGGAFYTRSDGSDAEWNMRCDPHAAAIVFRTPVPRVQALGLDVTLQCRMDAAEVRQRFTEAAGPLTPVAEMAEVWFRHTPAVTFHDPLAAACLFEPSLCAWEPQRIEVDISPRGLGQTFFRDDAPQKPHEIATKVDVEAFFQHYFEIVGS